MENLWCTVVELFNIQRYLQKNQNKNPTHILRGVDDVNHAPNHAVMIRTVANPTNHTDTQTQKPNFCTRAPLVARVKSPVWNAS